ncbi:hypothetical protein IEO21_02225 [Rhodonia placenta]|uniref:Uncharacterized protein n=1 Tax=Rhodonia placenta TaxID=104341 RepID=A0A8H7P8F1_9APHY|nr:hypothetical protein IEO21_02225 [Postia placenta]
MPPDQFVVDPVAAEEARAMKIARRSSSMLHDILCIVAAEEDDQGLLGLVGSHVETSRNALTVLVSPEERDARGRLRGQIGSKVHEFIIPTRKARRCRRCKGLLWELAGVMSGAPVDILGGNLAVSHTPKYVRTANHFGTIATGKLEPTQYMRVDRKTQWGRTFGDPENKERTTSSVTVWYASPALMLH